MIIFCNYNLVLSFIGPVYNNFNFKNNFVVVYGNISSHPFAYGFKAAKSPTLITSLRFHSIPQTAVINEPIWHKHENKLRH